MIKDNNPKVKRVDLLTLHKLKLNAKDEAAIRSLIEPGIHPINFKCHVKGSLVVAESCLAPASVQFPMEYLLGRLIDRGIIQKEIAYTAISETVDELVAGKPLAVSAETMMEIERQRKRLVEHQPKITKLGRVSTQAIEVKFS